jgi:hypothetical protein
MILSDFTGGSFSRTFKSLMGSKAFALNIDGCAKEYPTKFSAAEMVSFVS